jgi:hypothetical protein
MLFWRRGFAIVKRLKPFLLIRAKLSYNEEEGPYGYTLIVRPSEFSTFECSSKLQPKTSMCLKSSSSSSSSLVTMSDPTTTTMILGSHNCCCAARFEFAPFFADYVELSLKSGDQGARTTSFSITGHQTLFNWE